MSDLISRSRVISVLQQLNEHSLSGKMDISNAIYLLENQQTAYDVDKVVMELEENASRYTKKYITHYGNNGYRDTKAISVHKAIEIVKHGGVSDDVCEWKLEDDNLMTGCGDYFNLYDNCTGKFKHCPTCGKKIKIVGD